MPCLRQMSETVRPLARSRSASRSNRATSSAVLRLLMSPSVTQSTERLPFRLDQILGSRPGADLKRHLSPGLAGSLPLLPSRRDQGVWCRKACAFSSQALEDQEGHANLRSESPEPLGGGISPGAALRQALSEHEPSEPTGTHASPRPHIRRAHWHSFWVGKKDQPDARSVTLKWLPPIPVNVQGV